MNTNLIQVYVHMSRLAPIDILNSLQQVVVVDGQRQGGVRLMDLLLEVDATLGLAEERHGAGSKMWAAEPRLKWAQLIYAYPELYPATRLCAEQRHVSRIGIGSKK